MCTGILSIVCYYLIDHPAIPTVSVIKYQHHATYSYGLIGKPVKFRAITSILCNISDGKVLTKESDNIYCSKVQLSFKPGASTVHILLCTH